jgi:hypothetical protein
MNKQIFQSTIGAVKHFFMTDAGKALAIALAWQLLMTIMGIFFDSSLFTIFEKDSWREVNTHPLVHTFQWDAGWYRQIVTENAYANPSSPASVFYPLFPALVWVITTASFGAIDLITAGLVINTVALFFSILALVKIADHFVAKKYRWWIPALFITFPAAIFLHFFYTEAIFCALAFWAYYFALQRQWWKMGIMLAFLTATRLPAVLFIGLCALEFFRAHQWSLRKILNPNLLWFLLAPLGFIAFGLYLLVVRGDFLGMLHGYQLTKDWAYQVFNPNILHTLKDTARTIHDTITTAAPFDHGIAVNYLIPLMGIVLLGIAGLYSLRYKDKKGAPLFIFSVAAIIMFSLNSNLVSVHRYLLPCLVIYIAIVHFCTFKQWLRPLFYISLYIGVMLQTYLYILFNSGYFAG